MPTDGDKIAAATLVAAFAEKYWSPASNPRTDSRARQQIIHGVAEFYREMLLAIERDSP
jgi:hypothetical protein